MPMVDSDPDNCEAAPASPAREPGNCDADDREAWTSPMRALANDDSDYREGPTPPNLGAAPAAAAGVAAAAAAGGVAAAAAAVGGGVVAAAAAGEGGLVTVEAAAAHSLEPTATSQPQPIVENSNPPPDAAGVAAVAGTSVAAGLPPQQQHPPAPPPPAPPPPPPHAGAGVVWNMELDRAILVTAQAQGAAPDTWCALAAPGGACQGVGADQVAARFAWLCERARAQRCALVRPCVTQTEGKQVGPDGSCSPRHTMQLD